MFLLGCLAQSYFSKYRLEFSDTQSLVIAFVKDYSFLLPDENYHANAVTNTTVDAHSKVRLM